MNIKFELIANEICEPVIKNIEKIDIDINSIAQTTAISALAEIQECIKNNEISDFEVVEKIVLIFDKYHISSGERHDF